LQRKNTLSLKALFAPEVDGRGALGPEGGAVEAAILNEVNESEFDLTL
jgi:hypothetical protein